MHWPPQTLTTDRLRLRRGIPGDAETLFRGYCGVPACARYLTRGVHTSPAQTAKFLDEWCIHAWSKERMPFAWVIAERDTNLPIGTFVVIPSEFSAEVHFGLGEQYWARGLMAEAGQVAVDWLTANRETYRLTTVCDAEHVRSQRVLEKLGFELECVLKSHLAIPYFGSAKRDGFLYVMKK